MIEFKIGYIGKEDDEVYQRAVNHFKEKNKGDEDFNIVFENITEMNAEEIDSKTFHMIVFDTNVLDTNMSNVLQELKNSRTDITDINFLPYARNAITKNEINENNDKLKSILGTDEIKTIPINVSDQKDIDGYLDSIYISSIEYKEIVNGVILDRDEIRHEIVAQVLEALQRKDEKAGNQYVTYDHVVSVGNMTEKFARFLGHDEETVNSMRYSAMIHDTGKIAIPVDVLYAGITLGNEVQQMNPHDELGGIVINNKKITSEAEKKGMVGHHGKEPTENDYSNMITIIDSFDAMTSQRGYNCPKNVLEALEEVMKCSEPNMRGYTQFKDKEMCKEFVLYNIEELGKMGLDAKAMFQEVLVGKEIVNEKAQKSNDNDWKFAANASLTAVKSILDICEKNKDQIVIDNPPTKKVSDLGYTIDENGRLDYSHKTLKHDYNIRLNSEFEFQVKKFFNDEKDPQKFEIFKNAKNINELIEVYLKQQGVTKKEESGLWGKALGMTKSTDENGKKLIGIGREASKQAQEVTNEQEDKINLGPEIKSAAEKNRSFNMEITSKVAKETREALQQTQIKENRIHENDNQER